MNYVNESENKNIIITATTLNNTTKQLLLAATWFNKTTYDNYMS